MKILWFNLVAAAALLLVITAGCKDSITSDDIDNRILPQENISYSAHIQPFIELKCNNSGCHEDATRAGGLSLTSCANMKSDFRIVFPGNSSSSVIIWSVEGTSGSTPMPPPGVNKPLTKEQVRALRKWIDEGANCN